MNKRVIVSIPNSIYIYFLLNCRFPAI